jgi:hypothetical protein
MVQEERDMSDVPGRRMRLGWIGLGMAGLLRSGCAGALTDTEDLRVTTTSEGLYLFTRSTPVARSACIASGLDAARVEGRPLQLGNDVPFESGIQGCEMQPRNLIICQDGAADYAT